MGNLGVDFGTPVVNIDKLLSRKEKGIGKLTGGLTSMAGENAATAHISFFGYDNKTT